MWGSPPACPKRSGGLPLKRAWREIRALDKIGNGGPKLLGLHEAHGVGMICVSKETNKGLNIGPFNGYSEVAALIPRRKFSEVQICFAVIRPKIFRPSIVVADRVFANPVQIHSALASDLSRSAEYLEAPKRAPVVANLNERSRETFFPYSVRRSRLRKLDSLRFIQSVVHIDRA
jgi:hypothetical protein